jgi:PAS domain S-box-containing protein
MSGHSPADPTHYEDLYERDTRPALPHLVQQEFSAHPSRRPWNSEPTSHTSLMATGLALGGDVEQALENVGVPSYVLDTTGFVRWINAAAEQLVGDVRGRHFTSVVTPEDSRRARELFARKVHGSAPATEATGVLVSTSGTRVAVELSAVPLKNGERVGGVFGLIEEHPDDTLTAPPPPHLTPRQVEVLRLLERGRSTKQIAAELHLSTETVRNHIRRLFQALGVNSRLEAVAAARGASPH